MTIDDKIRDEKQQFHFNREAGKKLVLSSGKIDKCEYLTSKGTPPFEQRGMIE